MKTNFPGFSTPAAGTEAPLEMLSACHSRVERQCATLRRLVVHLAAHGADQQARTAATNVMRYFDTSARDHHADEEEDLFPALIESMAGSDAVCVREMIEGLKADHRALEAAWRRLRGVLEKIAAGESLPLVPDDVEALVGVYERHIMREECELLPMAVRLLGEEDLARSAARCASAGESARSRSGRAFEPSEQRSNPFQPRRRAWSQKRRLRHRSTRTSGPACRDFLYSACPGRCSIRMAGRCIALTDPARRAYSDAKRAREHVRERRSSKVGGAPSTAAPRHLHHHT